VPAVLPLLAGLKVSSNPDAKAPELSTAVSSSMYFIEERPLIDVTDYTANTLICKCL
jgi:hypothetical protein